MPLNKETKPIFLSYNNMVFGDVYNSVHNLSALIDG